MIRPGLAAAVLWPVASSATAHGTFEDGAEFYAGAAHPFLALEHFLLLLAFGLLLGLAGRDRAVIPLLLLAGAMIASMAIAPATPFHAVSLLILAATLSMGLALAAAWPLPLMIMALLGLCGGAALGLDTDLPRTMPGTGLFARMAAMGGVILSVFLIVLNSVALAHLITHVWNRAPIIVALRAAGSWISAAALMVLALRLRDMMGIT